MGGFVLWVCPDTLDRPSRHWTDRPKRRHHTHQEPGGLSSDADGVPT